MATKVIAKVLAFNENNQMLVLRRSNTHPNFPLQIDFPGGEIEAGEDALVAVIREFKEECGAGLLSNQTSQVFSYSHKENVEHIIFRSTIESDINIQLSWEHCDYDWITVKDLLAQPVAKNQDDFFKTVIKYLKSLNEN